MVPVVCEGDVDQLPPVGPGTVLSAAIQSGVIPVIDLREIFRQAQQSSIITAAHAIQQGHFPSLAPLPLTQLEVRVRGWLLPRVMHVSRDIPLHPRYRGPCAATAAASNVNTQSTGLSPRALAACHGSLYTRHPDRE